MLNGKIRWNLQSVLVTAILAILLSLWVPSAQALVLAINDKDTFVEYLGLTDFGTRNAPFRMIVPKEGWNGTLLVYSRGTGSAIKVDDNGPILDDSSGLPIIGVTPLTNVPGAPPSANVYADQLEAELLAQGYAMVASDYKPDMRFINEGKYGWVVEDGKRDTLAVTIEAQLILWSHIFPTRTLIWGRSQGSLVALKLLEERPLLYKGAITGSTVGAGAPRTWDTAIGLALAYDVTLGWDHVNWGSVAGGDIPAGISFAADVVPSLTDALNFLEHPANFPLFEFIRRVNGLPAQGFYPFRTPVDPIGGSPSFSWITSDLLFLTEVRADLEGASKANGRVGQNKDHVYDLTPADRAALNLMGLGDEDIDAYLNAMNSRTNYEADKAARRYVENNADFSGRILAPVISMHTQVDGLVIPAHESAYRDTVSAARRSDNLVQVFTNSIGHCAFTPPQWLATINAMESWLNTGTAPDDNFFPEADGFDHGFVAPAWPQPPQE